MPQRPSTKAREANTCYVAFDLEDDGQAIPDTAISTATMSLLDDATGDTINSRTDVDVSGYFDGDGHFRFMLTADDNEIVGSNDQPTETHVMVVDVEADSDGNTINLKEEIYIVVENLKHATSS